MPTRRRNVAYELAVTTGSLLLMVAGTAGIVWAAHTIAGWWA